MHGDNHDFMLYLAHSKVNYAVIVGEKNKKVDKLPVLLYIMVTKMIADPPLL